MDNNPNSGAGLFLINHDVFFSLEIFPEAPTHLPGERDMPRGSDFLLEYPNNYAWSFL